MTFQDIVKNKKAFLFDLDGTLVDSMWMWKQIDIEYLERFGIKLPEDLQTCIEGMSFTETACYFKTRFTIPDSIEKMKADWNQMAWDKYSHEVPLKPGVRKLLEYYHTMGIRMAIATSNSRELVEAVLTAHDLTDLFDAVVTGCDVAHGKPSPDIYLEAATRLQVSPSNCLVFEDIIPGIMAGKNAGMTVIAVEDAYSVHQEEGKRRMSDLYITNYNDLIRDL